MLKNGRHTSEGELVLLHRVIPLVRQTLELSHEPVNMFHATPSHAHEFFKRQGVGRIGVGQHRLFLLFAAVN